MGFEVCVMVGVGLGVRDGCGMCSLEFFGGVGCLFLCGVFVVVLLVY